MTRVEGILQYLSPTSEANVMYVARGGAERRLAEYEKHRVLIRDGRSVQHRLSIETTGFSLCNHELPAIALVDIDRIMVEYLPEVVRFVEERLGARFVTTINCVRRTAADEASQPQRLSAPAMDVHVDFTPQSAVRLAASTLRQHGKHSGEFRRFCICSVWRPLSQPPQDLPLAVCDGRTVRTNEGVPIVLIDVEALPEDGVTPPEVPNDPNLSAWHAFKYSADHAWYYFPGMRPDELLIFKLYDSEQTSAWRVPHAAFADPSVVGAAPRESVEVRAIAFFS